MRRPARGRRQKAPGGSVKFIVILVGIIATITYIFVAGPKGLAGLTGRAEATTMNRRQAVWDSIGQLEAKRQDMLIRAKGRLGGSLRTSSRSRGGGAWAQGYQAGLDQGYFVGSFLAENRRPNPLFFPLPNP
jgi:hypothetical protein